MCWPTPEVMKDRGPQGMSGIHGGGLAKGLGRASLVKESNHLKQSHRKPKSHPGRGLQLYCPLHTYLPKNGVQIRTGFGLLAQGRAVLLSSEPSQTTYGSGPFWQHKLASRCEHLVSISPFLTTLVTGMKLCTTLLSRVSLCLRGCTKA